MRNKEILINERVVHASCFYSELIHLKSNIESSIIYNGHTNLSTFLLDKIKDIISLFENNIIIPIQKSNNRYDFEQRRMQSRDEKGGRILDYRVLTGDAVRRFMGFNNGVHKIAHIPHSSNFVANYLDEDLTIQETPEKEIYDKLFNITYMVDDEYLYNFFNGVNTKQTKNIAEKKVKDCSVSELLFAVNKKLKLK